MTLRDIRIPWTSAGRRRRAKKGNCSKLQMVVLVSAQGHPLIIVGCHYDVISIFDVPITLMLVLSKKRTIYCYAYDIMPDGTLEVY